MVKMGQLVVDDILGDLCRFSGTRLTNEDEDLGLLVCIEKLLPNDSGKERTRVS